jgi:hypothetical protein
MKVGRFNKLSIVFVFHIPIFYSASNRNEYQESFLGVKRAGA